MRLSESRLQRTFLSLFALLTLLALSASASGPVTGTFKVVIIQTTYSDGPGTVSTQANLNLAAGEIHDYFSKLSFGALDVEVTIGRAALTQPMSHYWTSCPADDDPGKMCIDLGLTNDAAELAGAGGVSFTDVKTVVVLSPCGVNDPYDNVTYPNDADLNTTHAHGHVHRVFDTDCPDNPSYPLSEFPHLGPSGVNWHGWVHEIGHSIQLDGSDMFSHPGGYSSGYDLMDSCYPCGETVYSLSGNPVVSNLQDTSFPGWLPSSKTIIIPKPTTGTAGGTYVLEPVNKPDPGGTVAPRGIKLPLEGDRSIFVEARTAVGSDARSYGLFDEGIHMYIAEEGRVVGGWATPLTMLNACDFTVSGGCVNSDSDPRYSSCLAPAAHVSDSHPYCWPFVLWHPGDTFNDAINAIMMHVNGRVGDGYGVTVTRNVPPGHPDPYLYPWLTAPMNTYETVDIWVDSSCNGYEDAVGAAGLRYGRRGDTTVIGNGDDPCANHENRIYARVRNGGSVPANNITVHFQVTDPLGVGVSGSWSDVGTTTIPTIPANSYRDVYVAWTPHVTLTPAEIASGHFNFHSCVQIVLDPIPGEMVTSNNSAQENFDHFEAVNDPIAHGYVVPDRYFFISNNYSGMHANITGAMGNPTDFYRPIGLRIKSEMPPDWNYQVNGGVYAFSLAPHEVRQIPVKVQVPPGTPVAQTFNLRVTAFGQHHYINRAVPSTSPNYWHFGWMPIAGVVEAVQTVDPSKLTITAEFQCPDTSTPGIAVPPGKIVVKGKLLPAVNDTIVAIDYTPPGGGAVQTHLVHTNAAGEFEDTLTNPAAGTWKVRALWQGNMALSSSVSDEVSVETRDCKKQSQSPTHPQQPIPPGSTILLPPDSFPGGVLTGVVIGPDDQPVPNTPVQIAGGIPTELTGVVIGEEPSPERPKPDHPVPCVPDAKGNLPPGCPKPPPQTACGPNTPAGTPGCPGTPTLPAVNAPQDCANVLKLAQAIVGQAANQGTDHILIGLLKPNVAEAGVIGPSMDTTGGIIGPSMEAGGGGTYLNQSGGGVTTDAKGRFALCVKPDAKGVDVSSPDGSVKTSTPATGSVPGGSCEQPPQFYQAATSLNFCKLLSKPTMEQGGQTWLLPAVNAISPRGDQVLTSVRTPRDLQPGEATLSFVDRNGQKRSFTGGVFRIISASLDRSKLRSNEGADFDYEVLFSPQWGGKQLCINVGTSGPIVLLQPPAPQLDVNGDGRASVKGKIRATQVAPGAVVPFAIHLNITDCGSSPGPTGEKAPGPGGDTGEMKLSLTPGPVAVNPFVQPGGKEVAVAPQQVGVTMPSPNLNVGPEHTMDETSKYAKAPAPLPICMLQSTPGIRSVTGTLLPPGTFTQQQGLNYYSIQGCNFGATPGHVYLILHPESGPGFGIPVELYLNTGNNPWTANSIAVFMNPSFGGYLDQDGVVLQVVTAKGLKAELPHCKYQAERQLQVLYWMPRSQVTLGGADQWVTPVFKTTAPSQTNSLIIRNQTTDPVSASVDRSISNVGGPFTVQDDLWDFSALRPGFVVADATPYYDNWDGAGCDQTAGHWGTHWDSATLLRAHVQGCYHGGTGAFRTSTAHYGLMVRVKGPKDALPWPGNVN